MKRDALWGVVITVTVTSCCCDKIVAMSIMGIMWPWDIRGNKTKWIWEAWEAIFVLSVGDGYAESESTTTSLSIIRDL